ncbi:MAG TPA: hypothetical protein VIM73_11285, partial [Polyangiaceae bacterium]
MHGTDLRSRTRTSWGRRARSLALALWIAPALAGCGTGFDPGSEIRTLRVLGVQKSNPFPSPGETVDLTALWHDGLSDANDREIHLTWLPPCFNPPGDQYPLCLDQFLTRFLEDPSILESVQEGPTASVEIPLDILPEQGGPGDLRYGLTYVSFALCAGTLSLEEREQEGALPLVCRDEEGNQLGPDSFVLAYAGLFTYGETRADGTPFQNANPIVEGFTVEGEELESCIDG